MRQRSFVKSLVVTAIAVSGAGLCAQEETKPWYERLNFAAELRLRYEGFQQDGEFDDGRRDRFRFRFRAGLDAVLTDRLRVGAQLRSGDPLDPVSDNQTFGAGFSKTSISVGQVFGEVKVAKPLSVLLGKFDARNYWQTSDLEWDEDVMVEGAMEKASVPLTDGALRTLNATFYQLVLAESGTGKDAWLFGFQARPTLSLGTLDELSLGAGFEYFDDPQNVVDLTFTGRLHGNDVTNLLDENDQLVSDFRIVNTLVSWRSRRIQKWPLRLSWFWYENTGASDEIGVETATTGARLVGSENDTAYFLRVEAGGYEKPGQILLRYSRYQSDPDALFYAFMQSDSDRSSNLNGHRFDVRVGGPAKSYFNATYYRTNPSKGEDSTLNRWQIDCLFKF